jgi:two-component system sensor histidine kinase HydH
MSTGLPLNRIEKRISAILLLLNKRTDRLFAGVFCFQWVAGIVFAVVLTPRSWSGDSSTLHPHLFAAILLGALLGGPPVYLTLTRPGHRANPWIVTTSQMLYSILLIHITGGRIETHFHIFGSLAFLAFYRDWRIMVYATAFTALDHFLRGIFLPQSVYGVLSSSPWRAVEHSAWVLFEDVFLIASIRHSVHAMRTISKTQVNLEHALENVERAVEERTSELRESQKLVNDQQSTLIHSSKMSALGEMAGGLAHEINNPLAIIHALSEQMSECLAKGAADQDRLVTSAQKITRTADRIAQIIRGLRSFSRDASNDPFEQVAIKRLIDETLSFCGQKLAHTGTILTISPYDSRLTIPMRPGEISQVLLNLLNNANDALAEIPDLKDKRICIEISEDPDWVVIRVSDNGPGIPSLLRSRIFEPFFTTKSVGKGTGLGLSISAGLVRKHGGLLTLDPDPAKTCFAIRLPRRQTEARSEAA